MEIPAETEQAPASARSTFVPAALDRLLALAALLVVLLVGGYLRFTGLMWGDMGYPHPDERFLVWVVSDLALPEDVGMYFDTARSPLNPVNRGHGFFVYGNLPVIAARYLAEWSFGANGWQEALAVGRGLSAGLDLLSVLLVFLIAERLYGWRVAALAGLFSAAAVLQIQQSHFFTVDTFATAFTVLSVYLAVRLVTLSDQASPRSVLTASVLFGAAVGLAMASKINTAPVALMLPAALMLRWLRLPALGRYRILGLLLGCVIAGGLAAVLVFRVAQPYAFSGPGFFGLKPAEAWLRSLSDLRSQSAGDVDFPPALQWARRPVWFSLQNLVLWGLGLPLGALAFAGLAGMALRLLRDRRNGLPAAVSAAAPLTEPGEQPALPVPPDPTAAARWGGSLLIWGWTAFYFSWQSLAWNPTMRYQLPVYPMLAILAAWLLGAAWDHAARSRHPKRWRAGAFVAGAFVLTLTLAWALAFVQIYQRTETRMAATRWIFEYLHAPVNLTVETDGSVQPLLLPLPDRAVIQPGQPYLLAFDALERSAVSDLRLPRLMVGGSGTGSGMLLRAQVYALDEPASPLAVGEARLPSGGSLDRLEVALHPRAGEGLPMLEAGQRYQLALSLEGAGEQDAGSRTLLELSGEMTLGVHARAEQVSYNQPNGAPQDVTLSRGGTLSHVILPEGSGVTMITVTLYNLSSATDMVAVGVVEPGSARPRFELQPALRLEPGAPYQVTVSGPNPGMGLNLPDPAQLVFLDQPARLSLPVLTHLARAEDPLLLAFSPQAGGLLRDVVLGYAAQQDASLPGGTAMRLSIWRMADGELVAQASALLPAEATGSVRGQPLAFFFEDPLELRFGDAYQMEIAPDGPGAVAVRGSAPANETDWDMGLPFRAEGYDPFGGLYRGDLNFQMYWDDNAEKYQRFINNLEQADYIFISSNRQWGTTTRLPERYPLTTAYYRALLGCPPEHNLIWCYNVAEPGMFRGQLGFELIQTFTSYPNLGPLRINTQFAEEAFTVYDHPKVFIFRKTPAYNSQQVQEILGAVDLRKVVRLTPKRAADFKDMLLPEVIWREQQAGGTWARLFPPEGLQNRYPWLGLVIWYLALGLLGWLVYPLVRLALPGLPDRGYPLARIAGLLLLAYLAWLAGSLGVPVTRLTLLLVVLMLAVTGGLLALYQRAGLKQELLEQRRYFLAVEGIALGFFALGLLVRMVNPDLWHPIFGGEKPMDFSHFNAVMKSTIFPPYDPWFAGGSLNYYYYGYVLVGMPVKLLGITPSVAYNLILPALFSMVALAAFSIAWNLTAAARTASPKPGAYRAPYWVGLAAALLLVVFGNQGTVRMYWQGLQKLVVSEEQMRAGSLVDNLGWAATGLGKLVSGEARSLPFYLSDWYWKPSRAIQPEAGSEITEFPFFTFLYADLHAHLMALPVTLLVIAWVVSAFRARAGGLSLAFGLLLGALAAGALRPANTWDQYTYLMLAALALAYSQWHGRPWYLAAARAALSALVLVGLALLLYQPFDWWFGQGYSEVIPWEGQKTGFGSYLAHWGLFLFLITAWLVAEALDWMAATPLSALGRLKPYRSLIYTAAVGLLAVLALFVWRGAQVVWIAGPLGVMAALLLLRPGQSGAKRAALLLIGSGLALTLMVEVVAVRGDIARMNTVFKFYYQAWSLLALGAAASLGWLWPRLPAWRPGWRRAWLTVLALLLVSPALYPLVATRAKAVDRMTDAAPRALDGMTFMAYARYSDGPTGETYQEMDLAQDYRAIRWMQRSVPGSPVIVEAHTGEYRHWGTRFTIYTGLPGVIGWNWHQRQQRALTPDTWVYDRISDVQAFYRTTDPQAAEDFLRRYNVGYIILGQLERIYYPGPGLEKFTALEGQLWERVYQDGETEIYRVR